MKTNFKSYGMKHITLLFALVLILGCNSETKKKDAVTVTTTVISKKSDDKVLPSGDYSSLLNSFSCTIEISELASALQVSEADLSLSDYIPKGKCAFHLSGFGKNNFGEESTISWGPFSNSKAQNKKEIESYLKRKKEGLKIMGMDIELAETGDCYIAYQPGHGRILIYNQNYDSAFVFQYGRRSANNNRTEEQHEALRLKMTNLANYLLKKHRK